MQDAARQRQKAHDEGGRFTLASSMAKLAASEAAAKVADTALQLSEQDLKVMSRLTTAQRRLADAA